MEFCQQQQQPVARHAWGAYTVERDTWRQGSKKACMYGHGPISHS